MELTKVIETRTSVRNFKSDPVELTALKEMVRLAGMAPSINNAQPWKFIAITNKSVLDEMASVVSAKIEKIFDVNSDEDKEKVRATIERFSTFFNEAPAVIAVLNEPYSPVAEEISSNETVTPEELNRLRNYPDIQSVGAAVQNFLLAAVDLGYGACWLSGLMVAKEELEGILKVEKPFNLFTCIAVGKPVGETKARTKKELEDIFELLD